MAVLSPPLRAIGISAIVALAAAALPACYEPALRDCTVSCNASEACAGGQVCGADGWCAAPDVAGSCGETVADAGDAASGDAPIDATPVDALDAPIDAAPDILRIAISGRGSVATNLPGAVTCTHSTSPCDLPVASGTQVVLNALNSHPQDVFVAWSTANCQGQGTSCTLVVSGAVTLVGAMFE